MGEGAEVSATSRMHAKMIAIKEIAPMYSNKKDNAETNTTEN
jgi:hypothetical protein